MHTIVQFVNWRLIKDTCIYFMRKNESVDDAKII